MVSPRSMSDKSSLSILTDLNNAIVRMVSIRTLISYSSSPRFKLVSYNGYHRHPHVTLFSLFSCNIQVLDSFLDFFDFHSVDWWDSDVHLLLCLHTHIHTHTHTHTHIYIYIYIYIYMYIIKDDRQEFRVEFLLAHQ